VQLLGKLEQVARDAPTDYARRMAQEAMFTQIDLVDVTHALMPAYGNHVAAFPLVPARPVAPRHPGEFDAWEQLMAARATEAAPLFIDMTHEDDYDDDEEEWIDV
jgi:hypothetical protein